MGYSDTVTPPVIQRNIIENPGWYTAYTPYQAEIAQGRLEALLNFQTMVMDLTGLDIASASLLDEATAAAEAMTMSYALKGKQEKEVFLVAAECHPQTIDVVKTRASVRGIEVRVASYADFRIGPEVFGALIQYPATDGNVIDYTKTVEQLHSVDALATVAADLLSLVLLTPPGEWGADIVVGNTQRFGVPLGYGGPHAAYFATRDEFKRQIPGRIIGVSRDADGKPALRMALQTREQHIRREKATSNVCIANLLASFNGGKDPDFGVEDLAMGADPRYDERFNRTTPFLTHPVFNKHHAETEMLRYMHKLESRDLSLVHSMIPLGSCTMKLNATAEMMPITWPGFAKIHPFAPPDQTDGYRQLFDELESALAEITGFAAISLQPNAGSQGEFAGLLVIDAYHASRNEGHRNVCLIPQSAHGPNPRKAGRE